MQGEQEPAPQLSGPQGEHPPAALHIRKSLLESFIRRARHAKAKHEAGVEVGYLIPSENGGKPHEVPYHDATFARGDGENEYSVTFPRAVEEGGQHTIRNITIALSFAALVGVGLYERHKHHKK